MIQINEKSFSLAATKEQRPLTCHSTTADANVREWDVLLHHWLRLQLLGTSLIVHVS
jgi:hypothetical protein